MVTIRDYKARVTSLSVIARDVFSLSLELIEPDIIDFKAGQFINFFVPQENGRPLFRPYSIVSTPSRPHAIELLIKSLPDGKASAYVSKLSTGDTVTFKGVLGQFIFQDTDEPITCVATGVGIAPLRSMIEHHLAQGKTNPVHLIFGVRSADDLFWEKYLQKLAAAYPHFSYAITLSQPEADWKGSHGRVTTLVDSLPNYRGHFYICGNKDVVSDVTQLLQQHGVDSSHIHFERFN